MLVVVGVVGIIGAVMTNLDMMIVMTMIAENAHIPVVIHMNVKGHHLVIVRSLLLVIARDPLLEIDIMDVDDQHLMTAKKITNEDQGQVHIAGADRKTDIQGEGIVPVVVQAGLGSDRSRNTVRTTELSPPMISIGQHRSMLAKA